LLGGVTWSPTLDSLAPLLEERREHDEEEAPALTAAWAANDQADELHHVLGLDSAEGC
jgi:hypothetical protein